MVVSVIGLSLWPGNGVMFFIRDKLVPGALVERVGSKWTHSYALPTRMISDRTSCKLLSVTVYRKIMTWTISTKPW